MKCHLSKNGWYVIPRPASVLTFTQNAISYNETWQSVVDINISKHDFRSGIELVEHERHRDFEPIGDFNRTQSLCTDLSLAQQWISVENTEVFDIHSDFCDEHVR